MSDNLSLASTSLSLQLPACSRKDDSGFTRAVVRGEMWRHESGALVLWFGFLAVLSVHFDPGLEGGYLYT